MLSLPFRWGRIHAHNSIGDAASISVRLALTRVVVGPSQDPGEYHKYGRDSRDDQGSFCRHVSTFSKCHLFDNGTLKKCRCSAFDVDQGALWLMLRRQVAAPLTERLNS